MLPSFVFQISYILVQFDFFICPIEYDEIKDELSMECERQAVFKLADYNLPQFVQNIGKVVSAMKNLSNVFFIQMVDFFGVCYSQ